MSKRPAGALEAKQLTLASSFRGIRPQLPQSYFGAALYSFLGL